jgi:uncharacterized protein YodC (DUF2158 family)
VKKFKMADKVQLTSGDSVVTVTGKARNRFASFVHCDWTDKYDAPHGKDFPEDAWKKSTRIALKLGRETGWREGAFVLIARFVARAYFASLSCQSAGSKTARMAAGRSTPLGCAEGSA